MASSSNKATSTNAVKTAKASSVKASTVRRVPVGKLVLSEHNVRRAPPTKAEANELKASILASGVLQNLVVHSRKANGSETFHVACGGRRLSALEALLAEDRIAPTFEVPVRVVSEREAVELSLAENTQRVAMHPADEFEAFARIIDEGSTIEQVATRFGTSPRKVEQRLKLGRLAPDLLALLRDGSIGIDACMALTLTDDPDRQVVIYEQAKKDCPYNPSHLAHVIRRMLAEDRISSTSSLGRAITVEEYQAAGGTLVRDLFSGEGGETWFADPTLVRDLVQKKLDAEAEALKHEWKWVEAGIDLDGHREGWSRLNPVPSEPAGERRVEFDRCTARLRELEALEEDEWTEEHGEEWHACEEAIEVIRRECAKDAEFTPEQRAASGCLVSVNQQGIVVAKGILSPADIAAIQAANDAAQRAAAEAIEAASDDASDEEVVSGATGVDVAATLPGQPVGIERTAQANANRAERRGNEDEKDRPVHSQTVAADLAAHRLQIAAAHIGGDFEAAFDMLLWSLAKQVLGLGGGFALGLGARFSKTYAPSSLKDLDGTPADRMATAIRETLPIDFVAMRDPADGFAAMCALPWDDKQALFAFCIAQTLEGAHSVPLEAIGTRLGIDVAAMWRPTDENYWSRVRKDHCLEVARDTLDAEWAHGHAKDKKPILAKAMHTVFAEGRGVSVRNDQLAAALAWLPDGMGFARNEEAIAGNSDITPAPSDEPEGMPLDTNEEADDAIVVPAFLRTAEAA